MAPAWEVVADAAGVGDGTSLLDLGCGDGAFCAFAAARGAVVHGIDVEPDAVACALEGVPGADFRLGLMENLPWADASFDVVTAFDSLQYALDPEMALIEASRVCCVPTDGSRSANGDLPTATSSSRFSPRSAPAASAAMLPAVSDPVEDAIRSTRLVVLATGDLPAPIEIAGDTALESSLARAGVAGGPRVIAAAARWRRDDGTYRFDNRQRYWILGGRS